MSKINIIIKENPDITETECSIVTGGLVKVHFPANFSAEDDVMKLYHYINSNRATLARDTKRSLEMFRKQLQELIEKIEGELHLNEMGFYKGTALRIALGKTYASISVSRVALEFQVNCTVNPISSLLDAEAMETMLKQQMAQAVMGMIDASQNEPIFFCDIYGPSGKMEKPYKELTKNQQDEYFANAKEVYKHTSEIKKTGEFKAKLRGVADYQITSLNV